MRLEHHLVGGYMRYISPYIIIIIIINFGKKLLFPKAHWRILEDTGRFLARIPRGVGGFRKVPSQNT